MRLLQSFKMAWHAVSANKLRAFLTMLGIMIGGVALVVLVSIADGATTSVTDEISGMGSSYLTVTISDDKENPLKLSEISGFAEPDEVDAAAPMARTSVTAKSGYTSESMTLIGTTGRYLDIQKMRYGDRLDYQIQIPEELKEERRDEIMDFSRRFPLKRQKRWWARACGAWWKEKLLMSMHTWQEPTRMHPAWMAICSFRPSKNSCPVIL